MAIQPPLLRIGTRGSPLALAQAHETRRRLAAAHSMPEDRFEIIVIRTTGDAIQDRALSESGGKGLFTKEIDEAQLAGQIDLSVHSGKDLPTRLPDGLAEAGFLEREDPRDAFISKTARRIEDLPKGAHVGTASLRRGSMLLHIRSDLRISLLRGNVQRRLARIESGDFDATVLAMAGLNRLGLEDKAASALPISRFLPAVAQGAIGLVVRAKDGKTMALAAPILHAETTACVLAERRFLAELDGSCRTPIGGFCTRDAKGTYRLRGLVLSPDGRISFGGSSSGRDPAIIGTRLGRRLKAKLPPDFFKPA
jgi:hydroxymethylbilane synthase